MGNRLQRGRSYARKGQVISLEVDAGSVTARVQGSRARPYRVRIGLPAFGKARVGQVWSASWPTTPGTLATLLAGEMPDDIEDVFAGVGLSLFPASAGELSLDCSCPDWEVPCKHLAATFYLLAESFDDDPFRILAWRGRPREDLLDNLNAARSDRSPAADSTEHRGVPLEDCLQSYFAMQGDLPRLSPQVTSGTSLLDQLPPIDITLRGSPLTELLRPVYRRFGS